jgi:hypothetical protein
MEPSPHLPVFPVHPAGSSGSHHKERIMASNQGRSGQGQLKDPKNDGRMKENQGGQQGSGQGQVKDPKNDGRLKENRDK